jgi:hypothetical protein
LAGGSLCPHAAKTKAAKISKLPRRMNQLRLITASQGFAFLRLLRAQTVERREGRTDFSPLLGIRLDVRNPAHQFCNGLLHSVIVPYIWHPGYLTVRSPRRSAVATSATTHSRIESERSARRPRIGRLPLLVPSPWGEVIEHQYGWRSEYAAVRSIIKINGNFGFWVKRRLLLDLREKYGCARELGK